MNRFATMCVAFALTLAACASTPEGQKVQFQALVKIGAQAALEEGELSAADLGELAGKLESMASKADEGQVDVDFGSLGALVNKSLGWQGYKAAGVELVLMQADVMLADQGVVLDGVVLDVGAYSAWLKVAAKGVRQAIP